MMRWTRNKRRGFLVFVLFVFFLVLLLASWVYWWEPSSLHVRKITMEVPFWQEQQNGLRVAVLADLHVGSPHTDLNKLEKVVKAINQNHPDLVVFLGDMVIQGVRGGHFAEPEPIAAELGKLHAPLGVMAILGNHDWWYDGNKVRRALTLNGIRVLENEVLPVDFNGTRFWLAGLADLWTRHPDISGTLAKVRDEKPILLLTHNPDVFVDVPSRVSLTLAGHTHGGQVFLPLLGRLMVPSRYKQRFAYGHIQEEGRHMFVTSGVGTSILPVRFCVPPEVVLMTLKAPKAPVSLTGNVNNIKNR
jgi:uncharacterized protein